MIIIIIMSIYIALHKRTQRFTMKTNNIYKEKYNLNKIYKDT